MRQALLGAACGLLWLVPAAAQSLAWVAGGGSRSLQAIDTSSDTLAGAVALPSAPGALALSADGLRAYAGHAVPPSVSVVDTASRSLVGTLSLSTAPAALAVSPDGSRLFALGSDGVLQALDPTTGAVLGSAALPGAGGVAVSADGARVYVAAGALHVLDAPTLSPLASVQTGPDHNAWHVAAARDGRIWVAHGMGLFTGGVSVIDGSTLNVLATIGLGSLPGRVAVTPDGSRVYVGIQATWVDTGYGAGFMPGRSVTVIDAITRSPVAAIDLGADGSSWTQQNTATGLAVTADRRSVVIAVPRLASAVVADVNTNAPRATLATGSSPGAVAAAANGGPWQPYTLLVAPDAGAVTTLGGTAVANVLANDRLGGVPATTAHLSLRQRSSSSPGVSLNTRTGAVRVAAGTPVGTYALLYRACERASPTNCGEAEVRVTVSVPSVIVAADDSGATYPGTTSALNVLANDRLGEAPATTSTTRVSLLASSHPGLSLNAATGAVSVGADTPLGTQRLRYRLCEAAVAANCDTAVVTLTVGARAVVAVDDAGSAPRTGGIALASVLANDTLAGAPANLATMSLAQVSSTEPGVSLLATDGSARVAAGTPAGTHSLVYQACERMLPGNCAQATARVTVAPYLVQAVDESARGSSKRANTALPSVLTNDRFAGGAATTAQVRLRQVSLTPPNPQVRLDTTDGSVDILGKTQSGLYDLVYEICEIDSPTNCDQARVALDLSGGD